MNTKNIAAVSARLNMVRGDVLTYPTSSQTGDCSPDCSECGGVGYVHYDVPVGHPKFGKLERCSHAQILVVKHSLQAGEIDPRVGLTPDELRNLSWELVKKGVNQADRACEVTRRAYM